MEKKNINCIHCDNLLTGKQEKFCSERCSKRVKYKKWKKKHWTKVNAIVKTNKIKKKLRRKFLTEQEIKKREGLD